MSLLERSSQSFIFKCRYLSSGLRILKGVDLNNQKNIFIISAVLVTGIGGLVISIYAFALPTIACSLLVGILVNIVTHVSPKRKKKEVAQAKEKPEEK